MMRVKDPARFARRLAAAGYSQNRLADEVHLSRSYLSAVARGRQRITDTDAAIIARKLGVPRAQLFTPANDDAVTPMRQAVQQRLLAELDQVAG